MPAVTSHQPTVAEATDWAGELDAQHARIALRCARAEPRRRALASLKGLLSHAECTNGWQLAEEAGEATPDGMQHLVTAAQWDQDAVRECMTSGNLRPYAPGRPWCHPGAILVIDETSPPHLLCVRL